MRWTTILNAQEAGRVTFLEAEASFLKHCKIKNLSPKTLEYYEENLRFFHANVSIRYVDEVTQEKFEEFICQ